MLALVCPSHQCETSPTDDDSKSVERPHDLFRFHAVSQFVHFCFFPMALTIGRRSLHVDNHFIQLSVEPSLCSASPSRQRREKEENQSSSLKPSDRET